MRHRLFKNGIRLGCGLRRGRPVAPQVAIEHHRHASHQQPSQRRHVDPLIGYPHQALLRERRQLGALGGKPGVEVDAVPPRDRRSIEYAVAHQRADDVLAQPVVGVASMAAQHGQPAGIERAVVLVQSTRVLHVAAGHRADRRDAQTELVVTGVGRIALEVALQPSFALGAGQRVVRQRKMVHADVDVAGSGQPLDGRDQNVQLFAGRRHRGLVDPPLRLEDVRQMRVAIQRQAVRPHLQHPLDRRAEAGSGLVRQAVDQVHADRQ